MHHALTPSDPSRIILYLPSGLSAISSVDLLQDHDDFIVQQLVASAQATVVRVNYRSGGALCHPTPVHDVLAGYDWVLNELVPSLATGNPNGRPSPRYTRLGVCGQFIGASLSTMLALTECRMGSDRVSAAAVNNPIAEWVFPDDIVQPSNSSLSSLSFGTAEDLADSASTPKRRTKKKVAKTSWEANAGNPQLPTSEISEARDELFCSTSQWFDPFASPILFFRSSAAGILLPGETVPTTPQPAQAADNNNYAASPPAFEEPPIAAEHDAYFDHKLNDDVALDAAMPNFSGPQDPIYGPESETLVSRRRAHRIYPPQGSALRLPAMRISTSLSSPLYDQAVELTRRMHLSLVRTTLRSLGNVHPDVEVLEGDDARLDAIRAAERRVELDVCAPVDGGAGLWMATAEGERQLREVGLWFRKRLT